MFNLPQFDGSRTTNSAGKFANGESTLSRARDELRYLS
jgi:hypothetical protein